MRVIVLLGGDTLAWCKNKRHSFRLTLEFVSRIMRTLCYLTTCYFAASYEVLYMFQFPQWQYEMLLVWLLAVEDSGTTAPKSRSLKPWERATDNPLHALALCWETLCVAHDDTNRVYLLTNKLQGLTSGVRSTMGGLGKVLLSRARWFIVFACLPLVRVSQALKDSLETKDCLACR